MDEVVKEYIYLDSCDVLHNDEKSITIRFKSKEYHIPLSKLAPNQKFSVGDFDVRISVEDWFAWINGLTD